MAEEKKVVTVLRSDIDLSPESIALRTAEQVELAKVVAGVYPEAELSPELEAVRKVEAAKLAKVGPTL